MKGKGNFANILGLFSICKAIISIIVFYLLKGPNADIYLMIIIFGVLSIIGIILAVFSFWLSKHRITAIIDLLANILVDEDLFGKDLTQNWLS